MTPASSKWTAPPLQPLRIPIGWHVAYNEFFELDPDNSTEAYSGSWWEFKEDMLLFENHRIGVVLDLGWYPAHQPEGRFKLVLVQLADDDEAMAESWDHPLATYSSKSRQKIVAKIEAWLYDPRSAIRKKSK